MNCISGTIGVQNNVQLSLYENLSGNDRDTRTSSILKMRKRKTSFNIEDNDGNANGHGHGNGIANGHGHGNTNGNGNANWDEVQTVLNLDENKKQNHSEIEKRRRDKMNKYITELSSMMPLYHVPSRKPDKLSVLRMAVEYLKSIRTTVNAYPDFKPGFLSDQELKMLILQAADGFIFVVGCDRGHILYVSDSVSNVLQCKREDVLGQNWFDILHPKDVAKVKEQLSPPDQNSRVKHIDMKTMLPIPMNTGLQQGISRLTSGARRSFCCRMKLKNHSSSFSQPTIVKEESDTSQSSHSSQKDKSCILSENKFCVVQFTGYLKAWTSIPNTEVRSDDDTVEPCVISCLVAVGRIANSIINTKIPVSLEQHPSIREVQFVSRHTMDGKFVFVDQRATLVVGFLPQELLGSSMYEYCHADDISSLAEAHKLILQSTEKIMTPIYRFRSKNNEFISLQSEWKSFKNPWTKDIEYLISKNCVYLTK